MAAGSAKVLLISVRILAITIKRMMVVAFRADSVYNFHHENLSFLGVLVFCGETIVLQGLRGSQLSFKFTLRICPKGERV